MSTRKPFCVILDLFRNSMLSLELSFSVQSITLGIDMQIFNSTFKVYWTCLRNVQFLVNLLENLRRSESLENMPLDLDWFSIDSK